MWMWWLGLQLDLPGIVGGKGISIESIVICSFQINLSTTLASHVKGDCPAIFHKFSITDGNMTWSWDGKEKVEVITVINLNSTSALLLQFRGYFDTFLSHFLLLLTTHTWLVLMCPIQCHLTSIVRTRIRRYINKGARQIWWMSTQLQGSRKLHSQHIKRAIILLKRTLCTLRSSLS